MLNKLIKMFNKKTLAPLVAEFFGTGVLVMVALISSLTIGVSYFIATSAAVTLVLVSMFFNSTSGGHFNPAITLGLWTARMVGTVKGLTFIAAQMLGGFGAWQLFQFMVSRKVPTKAIIWDNHILVAEIVGTAILAMGLTSAITKGYEALQSALTYGSALFVGTMIAATASAAYLNPATALGLRSFSWVYVLGPVAGALVGVNLYVWLFAPKAHWFSFKVLKKRLSR